MGKIREFVKPVLLPLWMKANNCINDFRVKKHLRNMADRRRMGHGPLRVGLIVYEPESWDKLQPVYERMADDSRFAPEIIVVPSFDISFSVGAQYGYELDFFTARYGNVITAYNRDGTIIDLESREYDYIFYQDPYSSHYPEEIRPDRVVRYARICYVPYGYTTLQSFGDLVRKNRPFFRNVYAYFPDTAGNGKIIEKIYRKNIKEGLQKVLYLGYPSLEKYLNMNANAPVKKVTWSPRWSYDAKVGGSHFLEYKDLFLELGPDYDLLIRPHPMLFTNLEKTGLMSKREKEAYFNKMEDKGVRMDERGPIDDIIRDTGVLIADISSIIPPFFLTGKPVIYCDSGLVPNEEFSEMLVGIYVAHSWDDVKRYLSCLMQGKDPLFEKRMKVISRFRQSQAKSAERILDWLAEDRK